MKMNDIFTVAEETAYLYMLPGCNWDMLGVQIA